VKINDGYAGSVEDGSIIIYDLKNEESSIYDFGGLGAIDDFVLVAGKPYTLIGNTIYDYTLNVILSNVDSISTDKYGDSQFVYTLEDGTHGKIYWEGDTQTTPQEYHTYCDFLCYTVEDNGGIKVFGVGPREDVSNAQDITAQFSENGKILKKIIFSDPYAACSYDDGTIVIYQNWRPYDFNLEKARGISNSRLVLVDFDHDDRTGLGVIVRSRGRLLLCGFAPDTVLNWPLSVLYSWLEADIARSVQIQTRQLSDDVFGLWSERWSDLQNALALNQQSAYRMRDRYE
jgi:hypothetical protein